MKTLRLALLASLVSLLGAAQPQSPVGVERIKRDAAALRPVLTSDAARQFVDAAAALPAVTARLLYVEPATRRWFTSAEAAGLTEAERAGLKERPVDEEFFYNTKYGTPLAYARVLDVLAVAAPGSVDKLGGLRVADYGYGTIGHLRMLASQGATVTGIEVDPMLKAMYSEPGDTGSAGDAGGSVTLVDGLFPGGPGIREAVGTGFDVFMSKNTLKNGFIHPEQPVDKRLLVDLSVGEPEFLKAIHSALKPRGVVIIYNLHPAPSKPGEPYKHWADGRCPFPKEMWEDAGFEVLAFDVDDSVEARRMAHALGWDADGMNLENDLFALYTVARRRD